MKEKIRERKQLKEIKNFVHYVCLKLKVLYQAISYLPFAYLCFLRATLFRNLNLSGVLRALKIKS